MILVAFRGLFGRKLRTVLTMISIILGTSMISGTFVLRDQITGAFSTIFSTGLEGTDLVLSRNTAFTSDAAQPGPIPASVVDQAANVPGVAKAQGQVMAIGALVVNGKYSGSSGGAPSFVLSWIDEPFSPNTILSGHAPQQSGEVAVNKKLADDKHLKVGDKVGLATANGTVPVTLVGIFSYGNVASLAGATIVTTTLEDAQRLYDRAGQVSTIYVDAAPGTSVGDLKQRLQQSLPNTVKVETSAESAQSQTDQVAGGINGFLTPLLLAFAGAAVFVGGFIIFNTFSITVSQRIREFAMLRTIGASSRQVLRSVLFEALLIGLLSSILGVGAGFGIVLSGVIVEQLDYHWLFWIPLVATLIAAVATWRFIPESPVRVPGRINWLAAALMTIGISTVLLAISETTTWGWGSAKTLGLIAAGLAVLGLWIAVE
ncbi:MAG: putative transport system permease protein, partial [Gaiellales bacterium]|nr:putative transport system permease protein [Gaiellales bacterium]